MVAMMMVLLGMMVVLLAMMMVLLAMMMVVLMERGGDLATKQLPAFSHRPHLQAGWCS